MKSISIRDEDRRREHEQQEVSNEEVGAPQAKLDDLDNELTRRLRHDMRAQPTAVPLARPPRAVRLVVLELTREEDRDEDLVDRALDEDDRDEAEDGVRNVPELQEPLHKAVSTVQ